MFKIIIIFLLIAIILKTNKQKPKKLFSLEQI